MELVRWPGKPTSGRYVYRVTNCAEPGWYWQCDACNLEAYGGPCSTMPDAFKEAKEHSRQCPKETRDDRS